MQARSAEVIAGNYMIRYLFAALGSATVLPAVEKIGVGWFSTISAAFLVASSLATATAIMWGRRWREGIDSKRRAKRKVAEGRREEVELELAKGLVPVVEGGKGKETV